MNGINQNHMGLYPENIQIVSISAYSLMKFKPLILEIDGVLHCYQVITLDVFYFCSNEAISCLKIQDI